MKNMSGSIATVAKSYELLRKEWERDSCDLNRCGEILKTLKLSLLSNSFLPESQSGASQQELLIARNTLEIGALHAISSENVATFERYLSQLKCYYFDYKGQLPQSPYEHELLGLNLLYLLCESRLADFHSELERLSEKQMESVYIRHPVSMEQYLMEGSYNKVFLSKSNVPSERYNLFMNILLNTTRDEIAKCMEASYERIEQREAQRMLFFESLEAMERYRQGRGWQLAEQTREFVFQQDQSDAHKRFPSERVANTMLQYAAELEKIV
ncbi:hypothetical protein BOX15_Mlig026115g2 [Macrostomum lignano]|uniref:26S proteasome non-ATPase regulatory subunit 8 n=2 Tax=Macrostomum lignano TaxID=282301 RepID=A0A1I8JCG6_9PLAT|nr:hypothetical protein BOX15_Mlig026115g2 [Macrostomum lignano]